MCDNKRMRQSVQGQQMMLMFTIRYGKMSHFQIVVSESMQLVAIFRLFFVKSGKHAVALSRLLSARINTAFAGQIFFEISYRGLLRKFVVKLQISLKSDKNIMLAALRNSSQPDNSAKRNHSCVCMATLNCFMLLKAICKSTIQKKHIVAFL